MPDKPRTDRDAPRASSPGTPAPEPDDRLVRSAIDILEDNRIMAISTNRPDGWPQTTIVGYVNDGLSVYFMTMRTSQKFSNIAHDDRVSIAVGREPDYLGQATALFASARAAEVTAVDERLAAWQKLCRRHPNLQDFDLPGENEAAILKAKCKHVSVVDFTKGVGHSDAFVVKD